MEKEQEKIEEKEEWREVDKNTVEVKENNNEQLKNIIITARIFKKIILLIKYLNNHIFKLQEHGNI